MTLRLAATQYEKTRSIIIGDELKDSTRGTDVHRKLDMR